MNDRIHESGTPMGLTIALAAIGIGLGVVFYAMFGPVMFAYYAMTLPVGLFMLWLSRDVQTWEQKWAPDQLAHPAPATRKPALEPAEGHV
jgi:hypothetical protein